MSNPIPTMAPKSDADGNAYVFVVLVRFAASNTWSAYSAHRDAAQADTVASAQRGRVMRVDYFDGVPRDLEEHPVGSDDTEVVEP